MGCAASFQLSPCCCCCRWSCCHSDLPNPETAEGRRRLLSKHITQVPSHLDRFNEYVELPNGQLIYTSCWAPKSETKIPVKGLICFAEGYADCVDYMLHGQFEKLSELGYVVFAWDNLGQGRSDGLWNYVGSWPEFIDNAAYVLRHVAIDKYCTKYNIASPSRCFLAGHSMGGAYAVDLSKKMKEHFAGMILVAPMCRIDDNIRPPDCVVSCLRCCVLPCCPAANLTPTENINSWVTSDPDVRDKVYAHPLLYDRNPRLRTGFELLQATIDIDQQMDKVSLPFLILHGSGDKVTDPKFSQYFFDNTSSVLSDKKRIIMYPEAWHMLFDEPQSKKQIYEDMDKWMESISGKLPVKTKGEYVETTKEDKKEVEEVREDKKEVEEENLMAIVICGPSGVGKGTLLKKLKEKFPNRFGSSISHTTRQPRSGEIDGEHYYFITKEEYHRMDAAGEFIETAQVHGEYYATARHALTEIAKKKQIVLLEIDVQGAQHFKESGIGKNTKFLFINMPGGIEELKDRLKGRGTETDEQIEKRMKTAKIELEFLEKNPKFFDKVLLNDDLDTAIEEMSSVLYEWYPILRN